jgi:hypothetical protein
MLPLLSHVLNALVESLAFLLVFSDLQLKEDVLLFNVSKGLDPAALHLQL